MRTLIGLSCLVLAATADKVLADTYALSADGSAVVRLTPSGTIAAGALAATPLPGGYTVSAGSGASPAVTSYTAGFQDGAGGAQFTALYNNVAPLAARQSLNWVQVINTNAALGGAVSPYLDNAGNPATPFYTYAAQNRDPSLPANQDNFYDYSKRLPSILATTNPVTWNASLYPVITTAGSKALTVENGVTWGWTMNKATVGSTSATFVNPVLESQGVVSGLGTNAFAWGAGDSSSLSFAGRSFDTSPNSPFTLGTLTFHNGTIFGDTGADGIDLDVALNFSNIPEKNFDLKTSLNLVNTPNTDDPIASADRVVLGGYGYTFNVLEGATASVNIIAKLTTDLMGSASGTSSDGAYAKVDFDGNPNYVLTILGFSNATRGGFVSGAPEPESWLLMIAGVALIGLWMRRGDARFA